MYDKIVEIIDSHIDSDYKVEEIAKAISEQIDDILDEIESLREFMEDYRYEQERD